MHLNIFCQPTSIFSSQLFCFFCEKNQTQQNNKPKPQLIQPINFFDKLTGEYFIFSKLSVVVKSILISPFREKQKKPQTGNEKHQHEQMDKAAGGFAGAT